MSIELTEDRIPQFLKNSDLYKTLEFDNSFEDSFKIPNKYFRETTKVESLEDLADLLQVLRYWLSEEKPFDIYNFVYNNPDLDYSEISEEFSKMKIIDEISLLSSFENTIQEHRKIKKNKIDNNDWDDNWDFSWKPDEIKKQSKLFLFGSENVEKVIFGDYVEMDGLVDLRLVVAVYKGFLGLVKFLVVDKKFNYRHDLIITAIRCNEYEIFIILIESSDKSFSTTKVRFNLKIETSTNLELYAARSQDIRYLKYIFDNQLDKRCNGYLSVKEAASYGRIENLKFLYKKGFNNYKYSEDCKKISYGAAKNGHLEILKFYYNNGGEFDEDTINFSPPHLECLKFIHKIGVKLNYDVLKQCLFENSLECFKYTFENLNPKPSLGIINYHLRMPFARCNLEFSKYLYKNGYKVPNDILMEGCVYAKNIYKSYDNIFITPKKINDSAAEKIYCIAYIKFAFENCDDLVDMIMGSYGDYGNDETDEVMKIANEHFL